MAGRRGGVVVPISTEFNNRGLEQANKQLSMFGKTVNRSFANIGATLGGAFALGAITDQIGQMLSAASNLNESQSKARVVFGASSKAVQEWSATAVKSMGMTQQAALEAAGTYGNLFQAFGLGREQATKMSTTLVQLASDLASFNNTSMDEAIQALRSGLSGETEPLKRYGVALTDVRLRQEALNLKIYDGKGVLNAAQKAQASYSLILKDTRLAQGDFARTADGAANTMKSLTAAFQESQAIVGGALLRSVMDLGNSLGGRDGAADGMTKLATGLSDVIDQSSDGVKAIQAIYEALRDQSGASKDGSIQQDLWNASFDSAVTTTKNFLGGPIYMLGGAYDQLKTTTNESATAANRYKYALQEQAAAGREAADSGNATADANKAVNVSAFRASSSVDRLKASLDSLYGNNRNRAQLRLDLRRLKASGPDKSGERTVTVMKDGKPVKVKRNFTTELDARQYAIDYANTASQLAATYKLPGRQAAVLNNAQGFIAGRVGKFGVGRGYVNGLIGAPEYLTNPRPWEGMYGAGSRGGTNITIGKIEVTTNTVAEAIEKAKQAARLQGLGRGATAASMRYTGQAAAS